MTSRSSAKPTPRAPLRASSAAVNDGVEREVRLDVPPTPSARSSGSGSAKQSPALRPSQSVAQSPAAALGSSGSSGSGAAAALRLKAPAATAGERRTEYFAKILFNGAADGNLQVIASVLDAQQVDINRTDKDGLTAVHYAASYGRSHVIRFLVDYGADIDAQNIRGQTPLMLAAGAGALDAARLLLDLGANLLTIDETGFSSVHHALTSKDAPSIDFFLTRAEQRRAQLEELTDVSLLNVAAAYGEWDACVRLLSRGFDINAIDGSGRTALHAAARTDQYDIVKALIARGAKLGIEDHEAKSALWTAVENGSSRCVELLLSLGSSPNERNPQTQVSLIHTAASVDQPASIVALLEKGAQPNRIDRLGRTALHFAIFHNQARCVKTLIAKKADVAMVDNQGQNALHLAATQQSVEMVSMLLEAGADAAKKDGDGYSPLMIAIEGNDVASASVMVEKGFREGALHWAAWCGQEQILRALLDRNCKPTERDSAGRTPLHRASGRNHVHIAKILLDAAADIEAKDKSGRTPLDYAATNGALDFCSALLRLSASVACRDHQRMSPLHKAAYHGHADVCRVLLQNKCDINARDLMGNTALHVAALGGQVEIMGILLKGGASVLERNDAKETALHYSACHGSVAFVEAFLYNVQQTNPSIDMASVLNTPNELGYAALHFAAAYGHGDLIRYLASKGADINIFDKEDRSPLFHAIVNEKEGLVELMIELGADLRLRDAKGKVALDYAVELKLRDCAAVLIKHGAEMKYSAPTNTKPIDFDAIGGEHSKIRQLMRLLSAQLLATNVGAPQRSRSVPGAVMMDDVEESDKREVDRLKELAQQLQDKIDKMTSAHQMLEAKAAHADQVNKQLVWQLSRARAATAALSVGANQQVVGVDMAVGEQLHELTLRAAEAEANRDHVQMMFESEVVQLTMQGLVNATVWKEVETEMQRETSALEQRLHAQQQQYDAERVVWEQQRASMQLEIGKLKEELDYERTEHTHTKDVNSQILDQANKRMEARIHDLKVEMEQERMRASQLLRQEHASYIAIDDERKTLARQLDSLGSEKDKQLKRVREEFNAQMERQAAEHMAEMAKVAGELQQGRSQGNAAEKLKGILDSRNQIQLELQKCQQDLLEANAQYNDLQEASTKQKEAMLAEAASLRKKIEEHEDNSEQLHLRIDDLQQHVSELTQSLAANTQALKDLTRTRKELDSTSGRLRATEEMLAGVQDQLDETSKELHALKAAGGREGQLMAEVQKLKRDLDDQKVSMEAELASVDAQGRQVAERCQALATKLAAREDEATKLTDEVQELTEQLEDAKTTIKELERSLKRSQMELEKAVRKRQEDIDELHHKMEAQSEQANERMLGETRALRKQVEVFEAREKAMLDEREQLQGEIRRLNQLLESTRLEHDEQLRKLHLDASAALEAERGELGHRIEVLKQQKHEIGLLRDNVQRELQSATARISELTAEKMRTERELQEQEALNCSLVGDQQRFESAVSLLEEQLRDERAALQIREQAGAGMEAEVARLASELAVERALSAKLQRQLQEMTSAIEMERERMESELEEMRIALERERVEAANARERVERLTAESSTKLQRLTRSLEFTEQARSQLEEDMSRLLSDVIEDGAETAGGGSGAAAAGNGAPRERAYSAGRSTSPTVRFSEDPIRTRAVRRSPSPPSRPWTGPAQAGETAAARPVSVASTPSRSRSQPSNSRLPSISPASTAHSQAAEPSAAWYGEFRQPPQRFVSPALRPFTADEHQPVKKKKQKKGNTFAQMSDFLQSKLSAQKRDGARRSVPSLSGR